ncbi:hypothetical protein ACWIGM_00705 [Bosea sp. NPDC055332]
MTTEGAAAQIDAGAEMKTRLRADLRIAMKSGRADEAKLIRALVAAIDNAEAPPATARQEAVVQHDFRSGAAEVERLLLGPSEVRAAILAEIDEREHASGEMERLGQTGLAEALRAEITLARGYVV